MNLVHLNFHSKVYRMAALFFSSALLILAPKAALANREAASGALANQMELFLKNTKNQVRGYNYATIKKNGEQYILEMTSASTYDVSGSPIKATDFKNHILVRRIVQIPIAIEVSSLKGFDHAFQVALLGEDLDLAAGSLSQFDGKVVRDLFGTYHMKSWDVGIVVAGFGHTSGVNSNGIILSQTDGAMLLPPPYPNPGVNGGLRSIAYDVKLTPQRDVCNIEYEMIYTHKDDGNFGVTDSWYKKSDIIDLQDLLTEPLQTNIF